jgi:hypothetical protein
MTTKEKAEELVQRFNVLQTFIEGFAYEHAIECALIAVDEIISVIDPENNFKSYMYWKEVKQEIQKL